MNSKTQVMATLSELRSKHNAELHKIKMRIKEELDSVNGTEKKKRGNYNWLDKEQKDFLETRY